MTMLPVSAVPALSTLPPPAIPQVAVQLLARLHSTVRDADHLIPREMPGGWRGLAARAGARSLDDLRHQVRSLELQLDQLRSAASVSG